MAQQQFILFLCAGLVHTQLISRSGLWDGGRRKGCSLFGF